MIFAWGIFFVVVLALKLPRRPALLWSLALTALFSPYIWSWDFALLFPMIAYTFTLQEWALSKIIFIGGYLSCLINFLLQKLGGKLLDELFWWVPLLLVSFLFVGQSALWRWVQPLRLIDKMMTEGTKPSWILRPWRKSKEDPAQQEKATEERRIVH